MTSKIITVTAAAGLLVGSLTLASAQNAAPAETSTSKGQELGATNGNPNDITNEGRLLQENGERPGTNFAAPQGTTGSNDRSEHTVRPSEGTDK